MIDLKFFSSNVGDNEIVARYWALDMEGKFIETVQGILPYRGMEKAHELLVFIQSVSCAYDSRVLCKICEGPSKLTSRSSFRLKAQNSYVCELCEAAEKLKKERIAEAVEEELALRLAQLDKSKRSLRCDYSELPDDAGILFLALRRVVNPRIFSGFSVGQCANLVPHGAGAYVEKMVKAGFVASYPSLATAGTYFLQDGDIWYRSQRLIYAAVPGEGWEEEEITDFISSRPVSDYSLVRRLWLDYSVSDGMAYLFDQCSEHGMDVSDDDYLEIESIFRTNLEEISVAQLWSVIWKVVRDAASLSTRAYYNRASAAATIPGKIRRHIENSSKKNAPLKPWTRPSNQPAGALGEVFYELFGLDENCTGLDALKTVLLDEENQRKKFDEMQSEETQLLSQALMQRAVKAGVESNVLLNFVYCIRQGLSVNDAVAEIFALYPILSDDGLA